jgi:predicted TIM-barrel fold metal-dependent hydrolase
MGFVTASFMAAALAMPSAALAANACPGVIDAHLHAYAQDPRLEHAVPNPATHTPPRAHDEASHRAETLRALAETQVVRGVISGDPGAAERAVAASAGRLAYGEQVDGIPSPAQLDRIRKLHAQGRLTYIGEVEPAYDGIALDDPRLEPLWALADELQVPVAIHTGSGPPDQVATGHPLARARDGDPIRLEDVLARHPRMRVILMHMGWPMADNTMAVLNNYSEVVVDTGAIDWLAGRAEFHAYLQRLVNAGFGKRILFGSDQMTWPEGIGLAAASVRAAPQLTDDQKADILYRNARAFFGWSDLPACD